MKNRRGCGHMQGMLRSNVGYTIVELMIALATLSVAILAAVGWVWNVIKLVAVIDGGVTGMLVLRAIGTVVIPLGIVLGYL